MRLAAQLASTALVAGGAMMTLLLLVMTVAPDAPVLAGFLVIAPAVGIGCLAVAPVGASTTARIGRWSAWLAAAGGLAVLAVGAYAIATGRFSSTAALGDADPMAIPFMVTSMAWVIGSLGLALALVRARSRRARGPWLIVVGSLCAIVLGSVLGVVAPGLAALSAVPFAVGWAMLGWDTLAGGRVVAGAIG